MRRVPKAHQWVFWEMDCRSLDVDKHADQVIARILEFGRIQEVQWLIATYGMNRLHTFFRDVGHVEVSERTKTFWRAVLHAKDEKWADPGAWRRHIGAPWIA